MIEREPDWMALPADTPASVRALLRRCLAKDVQRRLHDIGDARIEIEDVLSGAALSPVDTVVVDRPLGPVRLPWSVAAIASLVALIAAGSLALDETLRACCRGAASILVLGSLVLIQPPESGRAALRS